MAVRERKWRGVFRRFEAFSDESKGGRRLKEVWVTFSVHWMAWTVAGGGRTALAGLVVRVERRERGGRVWLVVCHKCKLLFNTPLILITFN